MRGQFIRSFIVQFVSTFLVGLMAVGALAGCGGGGADPDGGVDPGGDGGPGPGGDGGGPGPGEDGGGGPDTPDATPPEPDAALSVTACATGGADYATIQEAIDGAPAGFAVDICAGTYHERLTIDKPLTLREVGGDVIVDGDAAGTVLTVAGVTGTIE